MLLYPNSKVYIFCAGGVRSDSIELCHRLCSQLIRLEVDAKMVYVPVTENFDPDNPINPAYEAFRVPYTYDVDDVSQNILIVPETLTSFLYSVKNIRRVIWWLSVDNFFRDIALKAVSHFDNLLALPMAKFFCFQKCDEDIEHWTQSEYAKKFLRVNKVPDEKVYYIGDCISPTLVKMNDEIDFDKKKDTVVYNTLTSVKIMPKLQERMKDVNFVAIQNVDAKDAPKLLAESKVYVDFGDFPSKEMMPRRAAMLGCVVVTGKRGAAGNNIDVNILPEFKFGDTDEDLPRIEKKIREILKDFKDAYSRQRPFRDKILGEKRNFERNISMTLGVKTKADIEPAAIFNGLNEMGQAVAEILLKNDVGLDIAYVINDDNDNEKNSALDVVYENYGAFLTLGEGKKLPIITSDEARFLYNEGRIRKIILLTSDKREENCLKTVIKPLKDDIISTNFEE